MTLLRPADPGAAGNGAEVSAPRRPLTVRSPRLPFGPGCCETPGSAAVHGVSLCRQPRVHSRVVASYLVRRWVRGRWVPDVDVFGSR